MSAPPREPPAEPREAERLTPCPRCGTMADGAQEYCLECGLRLPRPEGLTARLGSAWKRHLHWYPGDWIWPVVGLVLVAVVGALVAILATKSRATAAPPTLIATTSVLSTSVPAPTTEPTLPTVAPPTTAPQAAIPSPRRTPPKPPPGHRQAADTVWPARHSGYTLVLSSIPKPNGRAAALDVARQAQAAGLRRVGVLDSDGFSSLHPGYYVVFSGIDGSYSQANAQLERARAAGYGAAYPRRVTT